MSNDRKEITDAHTLSDTEARRVLARATAIDSDDAGLTVADLREAAREAGIPPHAFDQAVGEHRTPVTAATPAPPLARRFGGLRDTAKIVGIVLATLFVLMMLVDLL